MKRRTIYLAALAMVLLCATGEVTARVFARNRGRGFLAPETLGLAGAYSTDVRVNGANGRLSVWGGALPVRAVVSRIQEICRARGAVAEWQVGDEMAWGWVREEERLARYLVTRVDSDQTVVFEWLQRAADVERSVSLQDGQWVPEGSTLLFTVEDQAAGVAIEVARHPHGPPAVQHAIAVRLAADGWTAVGGAGLSVFRRGRRVCFATVQPDARTEGSLITVLIQSQNL